MKVDGKAVLKEEGKPDPEQYMYTENRFKPRRTMMNYLEEMSVKDIEALVLHEMAGLMNATTDQRLQYAAMVIHSHYLTGEEASQSYGQHCKEYEGEVQ